jgi:hypothetical protein
MTEQWSTLDPARVPPYLLTGGRVRPVDESLAIEAQVITTLAGRAESPALQFEVRDIVDLCDEPHAVVEVASILRLHLGVVRILVGDLVVSGYLTIARPTLDPSRRVEIIERVIRGLDKLD